MNLQIADILKSFQQYPEDRAQIYFLIDGDEIVYVGQAACSARLWTRLYDHRKNKQFTHFSCFEIAGDPNQIEADFIVKFNPKYNKNLPVQNKWKSLATISKSRGITPVRLRKKLSASGIKPSGFRDFYEVKKVAVAL